MVYRWACFLLVLISVSGLEQRASAQQLFEVKHFAGSPGGSGARDGVGPNARFSGPRALWGDGTYLYASDQYGKAIRRITLATGEVRLIGGSLTAVGMVDAVGTDARFDNIPSLWGDGTYLYIADCNNGRIRRMALATNEVVTIAGTNSGTPVDGPALKAVFRCPGSIWGTGHELFVADSGYFSIHGTSTPATLREIDLVANTVSTIPLPSPNSLNPTTLSGNSRQLFFQSLGQIYSMDLATKTVQPAATVFGSAAGIWSGDDGFLYASASTNEIFRVDPSAQTVQSLFGATNQRDWIDGNGPQARLRSPVGLWGMGNQLYIADTGNDVIRVADLTSLQMTTLAGTGIHIADQTQGPSTPSGVNWSDGMYLYFGTARDEVWRMPVTGGPATIFAGSLATGYADGTAAAAQFTFITAIWGDGSFLYVIDGFGDRLRKVSLATGDVTTIVSGGGTMPFQTFVSNSIWGDGTNLFVSGNETILKIDPVAGTMQVIAGMTQVTGSADGSGQNARFNGVAGLWGDGTYLYIADLNNSLIRRMTIATNEVITLAGQATVRAIVDGVGTQAAFNSPRNVWGDGSNLYVTDMYAVRRLTLASNAVTTIAGSQANGLSDGTGAGAKFSSAGTIWGKDGLLYIEDQYRVRTVNTMTGEVITIAGRPTIVADGIGMDARFNNPTGIWGDSTYLYVTDQANHVLRRINRTTAEVQTVAGQAGESGMVDGTGDRARFNLPTAICSDGTSLYIADSGNDAIRRITPGTWQVVTFAGTPGGAGNADSGQYRIPSGLWCDNNYVYVSDLTSIRRITIATRETAVLVGPGSGGLLGSSPLWSDGRFLYFGSQFGSSFGLSKLDLSTLQLTDISSQQLPSYGNIWGDAQSLYFTPTLATITPNSSILRLDLASGTISTVAGGGSIIGSEDGVASDARFNLPVGLWSDGSTMYVTDLQNQAIRTIVLSTLPPAASSFSFAVSGTGTVSRTADSGATLQVGYARIRQAAGSAAAAGMAIYSLSVNGVLVSETGVPAVSAMRNGRLYAESSANIRTGLAIANPNPDTVTVSFYFTDASGQNFNAGSMTLGPSQQLAAFLDQQPFSGVQMFQQPASAARTFTFSSSEPIAVIAVRGFINERGDFLMTTLPITDLSTSLSSTGVIPHFVEGGGWNTQVELVNPSDTTLTGTLLFLDQSGSELDKQAYALAPRSSTVVERNLADNPLRAGSIHVNPDTGQQTPAGEVLFSFAEGGVRITETGVAAVQPASTFVLYGENLPALKSGFAFANPSAQTIHIRYDVFSADGTPAGISGTIDIPPNGQRALFLNELPGASTLPSNFQGSVQLSASGGLVSAIGLRLRTNERGEIILSTTMLQPPPNSPDELYIPHFVYGGGFSTQFIVMSPTPAATTTLSGSVEFYSPSGQPLLLPSH
jgi:hypothetical protein